MKRSIEHNGSFLVIGMESSINLPLDNTYPIILCQGCKDNNCDKCEGAGFVEEKGFQNKQG